MRRFLPFGVLSTALALSLPVAAQSNSFYVDFGDVYGTPASTYGAAQGTGGTWNMVFLPMALPYTQALLDAAGNVSPVNLVVDSGLTSTTNTISFDSATTFGDDQALLDEGWYVNGLGTMEVTGLAAGSYRVYTYAMAPDSATFFTSVHVPGSPDPPQSVGGDFTFGLMLGVTHAEHTITITAGQSILVETDVA